jgi:CheY-like chemotaxis protein
METTMRGEPVLVMLVEDNDDHAELVVRTLAEHHVANKIWRVSDGQQALDYLFRNGEYANPENSPRPHLILLDLRLPRVDGLDVLKAIKESIDLRQIPVVVLTTSGTDRDVERAYMNYANSYLIKPVGFDQFSKLMVDLGFYWLGWNTSPDM